MNAVSMSTKNLRAILRKIQDRDLGYRVCAARDIAGPGGGVFIAANAELAQRHLSWLEQRNPARKMGPTYVEVVFVQKSPAPLPAELDLPSEAPEAPEAQRERERRAVEISRQVISRGEDVVQKAIDVFRIIGDAPLTVSGLRRPEAEATLQGLGQELRLFHRAALVALEEYLQGNTLIMDLIAEYDGPAMMRHGLSVAVFAAELCSQARRDPDEPHELHEMAEIFLGGFLHDCALWGEPLSLEEGHERMGAKLVWSTPDLGDLAPHLVNMLLFHSDIVRLATRSGLVQLIEHPDDPEQTSLNREFYRTSGEARAALTARRAQVRGQLLVEADVRTILPVALAEHYITQTEGFDGRSRPEVVSHLAQYASKGIFLEYMLALCNTQVEPTAPRRAYVKLDGHITAVVQGEGNSRTMQRVSVRGFEAGSISHGNDIYSPHLIVLYVVDEHGNRKEAPYVPPQDGTLWGRTVAPGARMYVPAGRFKSSLSLEVTGFMSEEVYDRILGGYERELKRQMTA